MLFNKDNRGSEELYELTGDFKASTDYRSVSADIDAAMDEVGSVVGAAVIEKAEAFYEDNVPTGADAAFLDAVRLPVAILAISLYARHSALSHGETGRKIKVDDNEKMPFEWMVDRDDMEMRERYYRALDKLFNYLEKTHDEAWMASGIRKALQGSIVKSIAIFEAVYPIEHSRYTFYLMVPLMLEAQMRLRHLVGDSIYERLIGGEHINAISPLTDRYLVLRAVITAVQRWSLSVFPVSVARQFSPSYQGNRERRAATKEEMEWTLNNLGRQLAETETELKTEVSGNPWKDIRLIPENDRKKKYFTV